MKDEFIIGLSNWGYEVGDVAETMRSDPHGAYPCIVTKEIHGYGETGVGYWRSGIQALRAEGENRPSRPSNVVVENASLKTPKTMFTEKRFFEWYEDEVSVSLRNKGGSYGGGSEVFVITEENDDRTGKQSEPRNNKGH